jgi:hypothetical protein
LKLTADQIAAAEECGVSFPPASPAQVQRYAMQRKIFQVGGQAVLATRDGALFETAATLERLIAEGLRRRRDLSAWEATARPVAEPPAAVTEPAVQAPPSAPEPRAATTKPKSRPAAKGGAKAATHSRALSLVRPFVGPMPVSERARRPFAQQAERWLTAGAERRGREDKHWSRRRK